MSGPACPLALSATHQFDAVPLSVLELESQQATHLLAYLLVQQAAKG